jgi:hypothetical protein
MGRGWTSPGDAWLTETARGQATKARRLAREDREDRHRQEPTTTENH